jgi:hypothetical protein
MSSNATNGRKSFIERLKYAFAIGHEPPQLTDDDKVSIMSIGDSICRRRMDVPAIMALETLRPMNFLASQVMVMLQPFVGFLTDDTFFVSCQAAFEKRESVGFLIEYLEDKLNERKLAEKVGISAVVPGDDESSEGKMRS